ncbi:hypothetical protein Tco_0048080, partial [Tanacetum coccineum]
MLGKEICEKVNEYLVSTGEEAHGIGVIQRLDNVKCGLLLDKSLRVVRAIHFNARFKFEMVEELKAAAANEDVKSAVAIADKLVESGLVMRLIL